MTEIVYSGFSIDVDSLRSYLLALKKAKKNSSYYIWTEGHTANLLSSVMFSLASNDIKFDSQDSFSCSILEQVIREIGYDRAGHYTPVAKKAMENLNIKRGLPADFVELKDLQMGGNWKRKMQNIGKRFVSGCSAIVRAPKNLWKRNKKYVLGAFLIGGSLLAVKPVVGFFKTFNKSGQKEIKIQPSTVQNMADSVSWHEVAKDSVKNVAEKKNTQDSLGKIIKNKQHYQETKVKANVQKEVQSNINTSSKESAKNLEKACNRAPTVVINDLQKKGILPADYREITLKKYFEKHPRAHVTEVPSRILLEDIQKVYNSNTKEQTQIISDYVNHNQVRFLKAMKISQKKQIERVQHFKNLKQLRDARYH